MPVVSNPVYSTGDTIEAVIVNNLNDSVNLLDGRTGGDPGAAGKILTSSGSLLGAWATTVDGGILAAGSVPESALENGVAVGNIGYTPVNDVGDTMTGTLILPTLQINSGNSTWQLVASGTSFFIGIPAIGNPIELQNGAVKLTGTVTIDGNTAIHTGNDGTLCNAATAATATNALALGGSALATVLARGSHTGTQLAATISDLATAVSGMAAASAATATNAANAALLDSLDSTDFSRTPSVSTYSGNDAGNRVITAALSREPTMVVIAWSAGLAVICRNDVTYILPAGGAVAAAAGGSLNANGFTVPSSINNSGHGTYTYHVFW